MQLLLDYPFAVPLLAVACMPLASCSWQWCVEGCGIRECRNSTSHFVILVGRLTECLGGSGAACGFSDLRDRPGVNQSREACHCCVCVCERRVVLVAGAFR